MLTGVKVIHTVNEVRLNKLQRRIIKMLEREVKTQCNGKFSESYAYQNMSINGHLDIIMEQIRNQIQWQQHAIEKGLL